MLVDGSQKTKQSLAVVLRAFAQDLLGRFLCVLTINANRSRRRLESRESGLLYRHECYGGDACQQRFVSLQWLCRGACNGQNLIGQRCARRLVERLRVPLYCFFHLRPESMAVEEAMRTINLIL